MTSKINRRAFLKSGVVAAITAAVGEKAIAGSRRKPTEFMFLVPMNQVHDTIVFREINGVGIAFVEWQGVQRQLVGVHLDYYTVQERRNGRDWSRIEVDVWAKLGFRLDEVYDHFDEAKYYAHELNESIVHRWDTKFMQLEHGVLVSLPKC